MRKFFGETASEVKQYFEVSAYRNILDMLTTMEGTLKAAANDLFNRSYILRNAKGGTAVGKSIGGAVGYAITQLGVPQGDPKHTYAAYYYAVAQMKKHFGFAPSWATDAMPKRSPARFDAYDLLNLARQIEWEMNRVRLPVPHNFRQINSWINSRSDFKFSYVRGSGRSPARFENDARVINYFEMIRIIGDELKAVAEMRKEVRKEIGAAALAEKVQENTLRSEQEPLISREQAEQEAIAREAQIRADKAAAYRKDYDALVGKIQAATLRADQLLYLEQLKTVVDAINALVADSAGRVRVPEVELLPPPQEVQQVEQAVRQETQQAAQAVIQDAQQAVAQADQQIAHGSGMLQSLIAQAESTSDPVLARALESDINKIKAELAALEMEKQEAVRAVQSAQAVQQSVSAGDIPAAREEIKAAGPSGAGGKVLLTVLGLWLLS